MFKNIALWFAKRRAKNEAKGWGTKAFKNSTK